MSETDQGDGIIDEELGDPGQPKGADPAHWLVIGDTKYRGPEEPDPSQLRRTVEPWLSGLFQSEHLSLLLGSGFPIAVGAEAGVKPLDMSVASLESPFGERVNASASESAKRMGRGDPNFEDQVRAARALIEGLSVLSAGGGDDSPLISHGESAHSVSDLETVWQRELSGHLADFIDKVLLAEMGIRSALQHGDEVSDRVRKLLGLFLMAFASRPPSRERLQLFTTNYDRLIEYSCDLLGVRVLDRFIGTLSPAFRASRLGVDLHYHPPGMRGEPRYLEGVVRLSKLHGSIDWRWRPDSTGKENVVRAMLPFGADEKHPEAQLAGGERALIYPEPAKDIETLEYPYAELFRDFAASVCQPNAVLCTYGYGFGDQHVNRVIHDMLTVPSTHLVIISYDDPGGRVSGFLAEAGNTDQVSILVGPHFGSLSRLVGSYLPRPALDRTTWRMVELLSRRGQNASNSGPIPQNSAPVGGEHDNAG